MRYLSNWYAVPVAKGRAGWYAPYRADHPIPPHRAYYFQVRIVSEGTNER